MQRNRLQVQTAVQVHRGNDVSACVSLESRDANYKRVSYWSVGVMPLGPAGPAPGVAAGVAGVTPVPFVA